MKTTLIRNLSLVIVIAILYWLVNHSSSQPADSSKLSSVDAKQINTITIKRQQRDDIQLLKINEQWQIKKPIQAPANTVRIKLILDLLSAQSHGQYQPNSADDLGQFGFKSATVSIKIGQQFIQFGGIDPLSQSRYILYQGRIHLVDDTLLPLLNSSATSFIDNRLINESLQIQKIQFNRQQASDTIVLEKGQWHSQSNNLITGQQGLKLIQTWKSAAALQVTLFNSNQDHQHDNDSVTLSFTNGQSLQLFIHSNDYNLIISDPVKKLHYHFPLSLKQQLFVTAEPE